jgi:hypothetical protein
VSRGAGGALMTDEELEDLFDDAIENFHEDQREAARDWFIKACAALRIIKEMQDGTFKMFATEA